MTKKLLQLQSLLNIMDREIYEFSETYEADNKTIPQRIDDLRTLVGSMKGIIEKIWQPH